jgi:hypothetical protein
MEGLRCAIGSDTCLNLGCFGDAVVQLCNDVVFPLPSSHALLKYLQNSYAIAPDCGYLASYADTIITHCVWFDRGGNQGLTGGQMFDTDGYNVIVKKAKCSGKYRIGPDWLGMGVCELVR